MRTTLTLDDDVAARLTRLMRRRGQRLKTIVNEALRAGLDAMGRRAPRREPFVTRGFNLGPSRIGSLDNIEEVLSRVEGENHR